MNIGKPAKKRATRSGILTVASSEARRLRIPDSTLKQLAEADREAAARDRADAKRTTPRV